MKRFVTALVAASLAVCLVAGADWLRFRGPDGLGTSEAKGLPVEWSSTKNIVWKTQLPGPGTSSPVTVGNRIYVTCYSGYALDVEEAGDKAKLVRHLVALDRATG